MNPDLFGHMLNYLPYQRLLTLCTLNNPVFCFDYRDNSDEHSRLKEERHHPHRLQGIEEYDKGVIFYSLGNFNFEMCGTGISPHPELSVIADITLHDDGRVTHTLMPIKVDNEYRPKPIAEPEQLLEFHMHISNISALLTSGI